MPAKWKVFVDVLCNLSVGFFGANGRKSGDAVGRTWGTSLIVDAPGHDRDLLVDDVCHYAALH